MKSAIALVGVLLVALIATAAPADITGTWVGATEVPDQGKDDITLVIKKAANGYTGTMADAFGMVAKAELTNIKLAGEDLTFGFSLSDGTVMAMALKVAGDKMNGSWAHPDGSTGPIAFERKKE